MQKFCFILFSATTPFVRRTADTEYVLGAGLLQHQRRASCARATHLTVRHGHDLALNERANDHARAHRPHRIPAGCWHAQHQAEPRYLTHHASRVRRDFTPRIHYRPRRAAGSRTQRGRRDRQLAHPTYVTSTREFSSRGARRFLRFCLAAWSASVPHQTPKPVSEVTIEDIQAWHSDFRRSRIMVTLLKNIPDWAAWTPCADARA